MATISAISPLRIRGVLSMEEFFTTVAATLVGTSLGGVALSFLASKWLSARIDGAIKHRYDMLKLDYEIAERRRDKSQLVAELMAAWLGYDFAKGMTAEERVRLNRLSFEASLWLPEDVAAMLGRALQEDPTENRNWGDVILAVRTHLTGLHSLTPSDVTCWRSDAELPNRGLKDGLLYGQVEVLEMNAVSANGVRPISLDQVGKIELIGSGERLCMVVSSGTHWFGVDGVTSVRVERVVSASEGAPAFYVVRIHPSEAGHQIATNAERFRQQSERSGVAPSADGERGGADPAPASRTPG